MKIFVSMQTNKVGSRCEDEFEIDDGLSEEETEREAFQCAMEMAEWNWRIIK